MLNVWEKTLELNVRSVHLLNPSEELVCSCVVLLGLREKFTQTLDSKWNPEKDYKINQLNNIITENERDFNIERIKLKNEIKFLNKEIKYLNQEINDITACLNKKILNLNTQIEFYKNALAKTIKNK